MDINQRFIKYLTRRYNYMSDKEKHIALDKIVNRLVSTGRYDEASLHAIIEGLREEEHWPLHRIVAYLDMIDLEDRT